MARAKLKTASKTYSNHDPALTQEGLNMRQEAYCRARAMGMSVTEACAAIRDAGSPIQPGTAKQWEKKIPAVAKRILQLSQMAQKNAIIKTGLDREWVISRLMTVTERCMQAEPVLDREGTPTGEFTFDSQGATRALELLGKTINLFDGRDPNKDMEYDNLTDDELARIATELAAQTGLLEGPSGAQASSGREQVIEVQAIPEADRVPQPWSNNAGEVVPSGQPVGQDLELGLRDSVPSDRAVPGLVGGEAVGEGSDGVGAGAVDGIDPRHDAEVVAG